MFIFFLENKYVTFNSTQLGKKEAYYENSGCQQNINKPNTNLTSCGICIHFFSIFCFEINLESWELYSEHYLLTPAVSMQLTEISAEAYMRINSMVKPSVQNRFANFTKLWTEQNLVITIFV